MNAACGSCSWRRLSKSEARNPKPEGNPNEPNPKAEQRGQASKCWHSAFGFRPSFGFRASGFGFRRFHAGPERESARMTTGPIIWIAFLACLAVSFVLSGMEAGVFALSRLRIRQQMRAGQPSAKVLHDYLEHPENFLWTILVGNTVANFLILGWLVAQLHEALGAYRVWFVVVFSVAVFLFYTFFDLLPKMLFRMYPNRFCVLLARPFRLIHWVLRPLVVLVEPFSD